MIPEEDTRAIEMRTRPYAGDMDPLRALMVWSFRNRVRRMTKRLREPRYLVGICAVLAYFAWIFGMRFIGGGPRSNVVGAQGIGGGNLWAVGILFLFTYLSASGPGSAGLQITNAEAQFLLVGPIERRALIRFKLAQKVLPLILSAAFFTIIATSRNSTNHLGTWVGFLMIAFAIQLVRTRASIYEADARRLRTHLLRRAPILPAFFGAVVVALGAHLLLWAGSHGGVSDLPALVRSLPTWAASPVPGALLLPMRAFTGLFFEQDPIRWASAFGLAAAEVSALYFLVTRIDVPFEEASIETAVRRARIQDAARRGGGWGALLGRRRAGARSAGARPTYFKIPHRGPPEIVFFWKNVVAFERHSMSRSVRFGPLVVMALFGALVFITDGPSQAAATTAGILAILGGYLLLIGPIAMRNDLRGDLTFVEILRTYPVVGRRFVTASIAGSVATILFVEMMILIMAAGFLAFSGLSPMSPQWLIAAVPAAIIVLLPILTISILLHNLIALYFPAWFRPGMDRSGGIEAMGLRMVTMLAGIVLLLVGVGIPGLAGAVVGVPLWLTIGPWALIPGVGAFLVVVTGEIALAVDAMGRRWDTLDPAEIEQRE